MFFFTWNPDPCAFVIPYIDHAVRWYGLLFAFGFLSSYFFLRRVYRTLLVAHDFSLQQAEKESRYLIDKTMECGVLGMIVGARLGHVFFYDWDYYSYHLLDIVKFWEGGLSSHGAVIGLLLGFLWFLRRVRLRHAWLTLLLLIDSLALPVSFTAALIRLGNFMNQEITGKVTTLPWGVCFGSPLDGPAHLPLHPVQLYEAFTYFLIAGGFFLLWYKKKARWGSGFCTGLLFLSVFGTRFGYEFLKNTQNSWFDTHFPLTMGQLLSLPCILVGVWLVWRASYRKAHA